MPTPLNDVITPIDHSPFEIESMAELALHLRRRSLADLTVQGLDLAGVPLADVDVKGALFIGCELTEDEIVRLIRGGAQVVPAFPGRPYPTQPARMYTPDDLAAGFDGGGFAARCFASARFRAKLSPARETRPSAESAAMEPISRDCCAKSI